MEAMLLFNIGDAEMTIGELTLRGRYLKTNVSYNVKKMVESGYIAYKRSVHDRRLIYVRLTVEGRALHRQLITIFQRHTDKLRDTAIKQTDLEEVAVTMRRLEEFWLRADICTPRPGVSAA
jgi:DNA-binding MarR family transcriptional regulator